MALDKRYMIAPSLQEYFVDKDTGLPLAGGILNFYKDNARNFPKEIYKLSSTGSPPVYSYVSLGSEVELSSIGTFQDDDGNDILPYYFPYDDDGNIELYYITVKSAEGVPQFPREAYPNIVGGSSSSNESYNYVRNPQFFKWSNLPAGSTGYINIGAGSLGNSDYTADDWYYENDDSSQTIAINRVAFLAGQTTVPGNPVYYYQYVNTGLGSSVQTINQTTQYYQSVQTFSGQTVSASISLSGTSGSTVNMKVRLRQYFGAGGSASAAVVTDIITISGITSTEQTYSGTVDIPSIQGKVIDGTDYCVLEICYPTNQQATINHTNVMLQESDQINDFIVVSNDDQVRDTNYQVTESLPKTGDIKTTIRTVADTGWAMMNDGTIGNNSSGATLTGIGCYSLFHMIWTNIASNVYAPIYTSAGVLSTYGASAKDAWEANKRLSLTKALGRVLAGVNPVPTPLVNRIFTATPNPDNFLTLADGTFGIYTGNAVKVANTGGALPTGLSAVTTYYALVYDANTIYLYDTTEHAIAGADGSSAGLITFTTAGTGVNSIYTVNSAHVLGSYLGEDAHFQLLNEVRNHIHDTPNSITGLGSTRNEALGGMLWGDAGNTGGITGHAVSQTAFGIIQPTAYYNVMIKL